jgi:Sigma-70, region 4
MSGNERTVLSLYYYEELTLREIGAVIGLHVSRIGQLKTQGILHLRSHMKTYMPSWPSVSSLKLSALSATRIARGRQCLPLPSGRMAA